ncbi:hypothetical protein FPRO05_10124 [Fusarium proliferatum]|uniref:Uncharacterized protein n=1 Tax=Gibberella intermedia TaxID=948311 RepID=A0A365NEH4_GIBIN|nr:hypothetical protein FPRO05_10124 [Fusarium proliferatum]
MSGLEPLAALGLVCNVLQLVEVGLKTATLCKNAYRTGEPDPELSVHAQTLAETASNLTQSLENSQQPLNHDDSRLLTLAQNCRDAEEEWRKKTPARFLSQQRPRKRARLGAALQGIVTKPEIDRLESQLQKAKESLEADLLVGVFKRLDISQVQTDDLQDKLQNLLQTTSTSERKLRDLIRAQVALVNTQICDRVDRAAASTKTHVITELASHESRLKLHTDQSNATLLTEAELREEKRRENEAYERILSSFKYPDMNHRRNEIHAPHGSTFNWLFDEGFEDDYPESDVSQFYSKSDSQSDFQSRNEAGSYPQELACSSFVTWLKSCESRYWISGHPGTGKSVLMKLIVSHEQTITSLLQWQPKVQIIAHFFWKVGSPMQSSFKGFLCSLVYQLFSSDKEHSISCLRQNPDWSRKTVPDDWDMEDLQCVCHSYAKQLTRPLCIFIDGIDEIVDDEGVGILIDFLDTLQEPLRPVKICMSSRPEPAIRTRMGRNSDIKMQGLTQNDIKEYVRATLNKQVAVTKSSMSIEDLVTDISDKAEGVFLWAILVTRSIARGISNGDSSDFIQERLRKTPEKLHELYLDMWTRLGEDSDLYQCSTALIFKIVLFTWQPFHKTRRFEFPRLISTGSISILGLMLALSDDLCSTPVDHFDGLSATDLEKRCDELSNRLPVRTADLLEVAQAKDHKRPHEIQWIDKPHSPLFRYDELGVKAIHRTVFDFLIETEDGKNIMEHHKGLPEEIFIRTFRSRILQDCLWPAVQYPLGENEEDRHWISAWRRLDIQLQVLSYHTDTIQSSTLVEMLDLSWASFVQMTKNLPSHPSPSAGIVKRVCKLDYLLRVALKGFDAYMRDYLIEWDSNRQFDALHKVLIACLGSGGYGLCTDFEWAGIHRLIERILWIIVSADGFRISLPSGFQLSNDTLLKTSMACVLISAVDTSRVVHSKTYRGSPLDAHRTNTILRMIRDFQHLLCLGDHILVTLYQMNGWPSSRFISFTRGSSFEEVIYVEISMSILVQVFLQHVVQDDATLSHHEVEQDLNLKAFPQTLRPIMLGVGGLFVEPSRTDLPVFQRYCHGELLPELSSPSSQHLEDKKWCEVSMRRSQRDMREREHLTGSRVETTNGIEEGIGPNGMNYYLCNSCEAREIT